jgi:hypothetical protein
VELVRQHSLFWHRMWSDCGRPRTGTVADNMRRTRAAYHSVVKRVKLNERMIIRQRFGEAALKTGNRDNWAEVRRLTGNRGLQSNMVDNKCNPQDVASLLINVVIYIVLYKRSARAGRPAGRARFSPREKRAGPMA